MNYVFKKYYPIITKSGCKCLIAGLLLTIFFAFPSYCWKIGSSDSRNASADSGHIEKKGNKAAIAGMFFDDRYAQNGFNYVYPQKSYMEITKDFAKKGKTSLFFDLEPDSFSGGSVCLHDKTYDLRPYISKGAVQFWIKGARGGEKAWVALVDEDLSDKHKTVVRVDINWFGPIGTEWSFISIPLEHFGEQGVYWDEAQQREIDAPFNWDKVAEFRIESRKDENTVFRVWVDEIIIVKSIR